MSSLRSRVQSGRGNTLWVMAIVGAVALAGCQGDLVAAPLSSSSGVPATPAATTPRAKPLLGLTFYLDQASNARLTADSWRSTRPADAQQMDKVATQPVAKWFGDWNTNVRGDVASAISAIQAAGKAAVLVAYNIPQRDCGGYSGANGTTPDGYRSWIDGFAQGLGDANSVVILEPDALAAIDCLSTPDQATRLDLLRYAVSALSMHPNARVYLDAGNPAWIPATTMADRLTRAGLATAAGFSLNVSNFFTDASNVSYGTQIAGLSGGKHFIIDSGRNGLGPTSDAKWCNPDGRALGRRPTTNTGNALVDAFLWVKTPGESDGACNGAPAAGQWMPEYALGLAERG